jgi:hypothetical protein
MHTYHYAMWWNVPLECGKRVGDFANDAHVSLQNISSYFSGITDTT